MAIKKQGYLLIGAIVALFAVSTQQVFSEPADSAGLLVRLFALYGYMMLAVTAAMTPFLVGIARAFGKPFLKIHHALAIFGIIFATLHPVVLAIRISNIAIFLPSFESWERFWSLAGRPALIIFYVALVAAILRRTMLKQWRLFHGLMYVVLLFGIVHANLSGTDFQNIGVKTLFNLLFLMAVSAFPLKRARNYAVRKRARSMQMARGSEP
jgi:DMSO/TMAO reductase YedYZ heme-binding membrane subunit